MFCCAKKAHDIRDQDIQFDPFEIDTISCLKVGPRVGGLHLPEGAHMG